MSKEPERFLQHLNIEMHVANSPFSLEDLNRAFYQHYPRDYFLHVQSLIFTTLSSTEQVLALAKDTQEIVDPVTNLRLQMSLVDEASLSDDVMRSMKLLLGSVYHHALETLLRLFWAHQPGVELPWLALSREFDFRTFKQKQVSPLTKLAEEWTGSAQIDQTIRSVFSTDRSIDGLLLRQLSNVKQWIRLAAIETLNTVDYNAYKHGLGLMVGEEEIQFPVSRDDPNVQPLVTGGGDVLISLVAQRSEDGIRRWSRRVRYLHIQERMGTIFVAQRLVSQEILSGLLDGLHYFLSSLDLEHGTGSKRAGD